MSYPGLLDKDLSTGYEEHSTQVRSVQKKLFEKYFEEFEFMGTQSENEQVTSQLGAVKVP